MIKNKINYEQFHLTIGCMILALVLVLNLSGQPFVLAKEIPVGGMFDLTGPTADACKDYYAGALAATKYINEHGGINGDTIRLAVYDYSYRLRENINIDEDILNVYSKILYIDRAKVILGWGSLDTYVLRIKIQMDSIVFFSGHYDANFTDPRESPYNFFVGTDYSTSIRAALKFAKERGAKKFVFIFPDHPYGKNPIPAGKQYATLIDLEYGPDELVDLRAIDATSQLQHMKMYDPDFAWIGGTTASAAIIIRDAAKLGLRTKFIVNCWGFDEDLIKIVGSEAIGRVFGLMPVAPFGGNVPGMKDVLSYAVGSAHTSTFLKGWVSMLVIAEGLRRVPQSSVLDGQAIKAGLESIKDLDTGGLTAPISYSISDHRPNLKLAIYQINKELKFEKVQDISLSRDNKMVGR